MVFRDGSPYDGYRLNDNVEETYKKGVLLSEKRYNNSYYANGKPAKSVYFERKLTNRDVYEGKVFSKTLTMICWEKERKQLELKKEWMYAKKMGAKK